jgi:hypothetical protein
MALTSPGVEVTITDQSQYLPAPTNSVPLVIIATAQNKANGSGTAVASATTLANANKLYQVTSQRDLVNLYGVPFFYTTTNGTPMQGYELNEYGLLAAYSLLGVSNRCYVLRADINLASLVGQTGRPVGEPANGTYWLDSVTSTWGIYEFNATQGKFALKTPIVLTDSTSFSGTVPLASIGNIGDYAVDARDTINSSYHTYFRKSSLNVWNNVGGMDWKGDLPTVQATNSNPSLNAGDTFNINLNSLYTVSIAVPASPNNTVAGVASAINGLGWIFLSANVVSGKLCIYSKQYAPLTEVDPTAAVSLVITAGLTGTAIADLGITAKTYYQPTLFYGTAAEMPYWTSSQLYPRPSGSVWIKVGAAGNGLATTMAAYSTLSKVWVTKPVSFATSDWAVTSALDSTGGQAIPAGTIYTQYDYDTLTVVSPLFTWLRSATGPTIVTGTTTNPVFDITTMGFAGPYRIHAQSSTPGSTVLGSTKSVIIPDGAAATDFVTAWTAANVLYTTASVTSDGAIQLTHTQGGEIIIDSWNTTTTGTQNNALAVAGLVAGVTQGIKGGPPVQFNWTYVPQISVTPAGGVGFHISVNTAFGTYFLNGTGVAAGGGGTGYTLGDHITINGSSLGGVNLVNDLVVEVAEVTGGIVSAVTYISGNSVVRSSIQLSNWQDFSYTANEGAPTVAPIEDTNWYYTDQTFPADIMVQKGGAWIGYSTTAYDTNGAPAATGSNTTDPAGPIIAAVAPTTQSDGTALSYGDLWISTADLEMYPVISRWQQVDAVDMWVLLDNADQTSSIGVLFQDARWAPNGTTSPSDDPIPTIVSLLTSSYLDLDAPSPALYPQGMLLFNTRRSSYNVKQFRIDYFNTVAFPGATLPAQTSAWVTASGNQADGSPYMGRKAQRAMVVKSLNAAVASNTDIRDEDNFFNLIASPNYPELQPTMVTLNADRGETAYIIGDTPMRLADSATEIQAWATNAAGAVTTGEAGLVTRNTYLGIFYPSGMTTDLSGNLVAVPSSHMMLRTFLRNDTIAYPWFAAAGTRRGTIDNATNIGYVDSVTGEFITIKTRIGIRDVLYINFINPMVFFTGVGLLNYGNKTSYNSSSALDRTNVARLVAYIRRQLTLASRPFVFEPNDALTRQQIAAVVQTLMVDLVAKRGIYDYLVVCDASNNTPARIDRNELWIDVAIEPVKSAEMIYIPVRILNTGELSNK